MNYKNITMEYQKIVNQLENTPNQPSKFGTHNSVKVNDESRGIYNINSQIKFKTSMLTSSLCYCNDPCILVSAAVTVPNTAATGAAANNTKNIIIQNSAPFTNCISEINSNADVEFNRIQ